MNNIIRTNIKVLHNKEYNFLDVAFSGFISYEELVEICEYEFQLIEHYKIKKCLINLREINIYPPGGEEFIKTCWFPKVIELEVKAIAIVVPDDVFAQLSMQEAHDLEQIPVTVQHFAEGDAARQWLESKVIYDDSNNNILTFL
ncbi:MAG TPA: STAS/SEC14 domain-containing protein [Cyclobacteriaceae bacterium]|jgi:hypothetical protein|nr:STAS/SEC14 domain-containing protein [Cyclobacteriaceae bacterium]